MPYAPFRWVGGKSRTAPQIAERIIYNSAKTDTLIVPFLGAGHVFQQLAKYFGRLVLADINEDLMMCYRQMRDDVETFIVEYTKWFARGQTKEDFYEIRDIFNATDKEDPSRAPLFMYLNRHSFGGIVRYNAKGEFKSPCGPFYSSYLPDLECRRYSQFFNEKETVLLAKSFEETMKLAHDQSVVYCDPPYKISKGEVSFYDYGFMNMTDHIVLARAVKEAQGRGADVFVSNEDSEYVRDLYREATDIWTMTPARTLSRKRRPKASELLAYWSGHD